MDINKEAKQLIRQIHSAYINEGVLEERDREQTKVLESYAKELARKAFYTNPLTYIQEYGREDAFEKYFESLTADR